MNREEAPGKSPEDMYIQQKVRVLLMLKKMGSNVGTLSRHGSSEVGPCPCVVPVVHFQLILAPPYCGLLVIQSMFEEH